jgi:hypothetical protein
MWISVGTPRFSLDQIEAVLSEVTAEPDGLEARYIGTTPTGEIRIVSLWESHAHAERFFADSLGPAIAKVLGPESVDAAEVVGIDVARSYVT